ncbi:hypothetical protein HAX54_030932 [Datura stramonium]|uniref:Uncharacterized protein n=1 Tax=Datura stramonium TaxID=4076 RepID=A0ABS8SCD0_DATST|nr:hypothetical protein [Datura stramonium]
MAEKTRNSKIATKVDPAIATLQFNEAALGDSVGEPLGLAPMDDGGRTPLLVGKLLAVVPMDNGRRASLPEGAEAGVSAVGGTGGDDTRESDCL